ncbi:MAG TPA: hypothetical protein VFP68_22075, partial [Burkholderiaceae bacterium]|nr:hypothetical protein [Burkholderiaceae bacterium]
MSAAAPSPKDAPHRPTRRWAAAVLALLALVAIGVGGVSWWIWHHEAGLRWALRHVPGLTLEGQQGMPTGGPFRADRLQYSASGWRILIEDLSWRDARWQWRPYSGAWVGLHVDEPHAARVTAIPPPPKADTSSPQPPATLRLPLEILVRGLRVDALQIGTQVPITNLQAGMHLGADNGAVHRVTRIAARRDGLAVEGSGSVGTDGPMPVEARLDVRTQPDAAQMGSAHATLSGVVRRLVADATLQIQAPMRETAGRTELHAGASATLQATMTPFEPWPIAALSAQTQDLDLSALSAALPATRLTGRAVLDEHTVARPLRLEVDLHNALAGTWDAGRLPLRQVRAALQANPGQFDVLTFDTFEVELGSGQPAGRVSGNGRWQRDTMTIEARLDGLRPARLDTHAASMLLGGPLTLTLRGLSPPSAGPTSPASAPAPAAIASNASNASNASRPAAAGLSGELRAALDGRLNESATESLGATIDIAFALPRDGSMALDIREMVAHKGLARASASGKTRRAADGALRFQAQGALEHFNPADWWAALAGPTRNNSLNGRWGADLALPAPPYDNVLAALRGDASLTLNDSRFAAVPLRGMARMKASEQALAVSADMHAGSNRVQIDGQAGVASRTPQWKVDVDAPSLADLAPL